MRIRTAPSVIVALLLTLPASAASINYGNFGPVAPGITFSNVIEESVDPLPLFGPPSVFPIGLDFNPTPFSVYANAGASDSVASELSFSVTSTLAALRIDGLSIAEAGDYTIVGSGTAATNVSATANIRATVTHINGVPVAPINLTPINASVSFNLAANSGVVQPWSVGAAINVQAQLQGLGFGVNDFATGINFEIDNILGASSQSGSAASIAKKDFRVDVQVTQFIPEPGSLLLASLAAGTLLMRRRHPGRSM